MSNGAVAKGNTQRLTRSGNSHFGLQALVYRLAYNDDLAAGQLAVSRGGPSRTGGRETCRRVGGSAGRRLQSIINSVETSRSL